MCVLLASVCTADKQAVSYTVTLAIDCQYDWHIAGYRECVLQQCVAGAQSKVQLMTMASSVLCNTHKEALRICTTCARCSHR